jgi:hypothetical protein
MVCGNAYEIPFASEYHENKVCLFQNFVHSNYSKLQLMM